MGLESGVHKVGVIQHIDPKIEPLGLETGGNSEKTPAAGGMDI